MPRVPWTLLLLPALLVASPAVAEPAGPRLNAPVLGMGGAGRALPWDTSNVDLNPGAMALGDRYAVELSFGIMGGGTAGAGRMAVTDARTSPLLAAGVAYDMGWRDAVAPEPGWVVTTSPTQDQAYERYRDLTVAAAVPLGGERAGVGVSVDAVRRAPPGEEAQREITLGAGVLVRPVDPLFLAVTGANLIPVDDGDHPTTLAVAAGVAPLPELRAAADLALSRDAALGWSPAVHLGAAAVLGDVVSVRAGFYTDVSDGARHPWATVGAGLGRGRACLSYALRVQMDGLGAGGEETSPLYHLITLQIVPQGALEEE